MIILINLINNCNFDFNNYSNFTLGTTKRIIIKRIKTYCLQVFHSFNNKDLLFNSNFNFALIFIQQLFLCITSTELEKKFRAEIDKNYLLSLLPTNKGSFQHWTQLVNTFAYYQQASFQNFIDLDLWAPIHQDLAQPSIYLNGILKKTAEKNCTPHYFSIFTDRFIKMMNRRIDFKFQSKQYSLNFVISKAKTQHLIINKYINYHHKIKDSVWDEKEDEMEELYLESNMTVPDESSIVDAFENIGDCFDFDQGFKVEGDRISYQFQVVQCIGGLNQTRKFNMLRQHGNNLIIITDCLDIKFLTWKWDVEFFRPVNWLLNESYDCEQLLVIVWTDLKLNKSIYEQTLSLRHIDKFSLQFYLENIRWYNYYDELGVLVDKREYDSASYIDKYKIMSVQTIEHFTMMTQNEELDKELKEIKESRLIKMKENEISDEEKIKIEKVEELVKLGVDKEAAEKIIMKSLMVREEHNFAQLLVSLMVKSKNFTDINDSMIKIINNQKGEVLNKILNFPEVYSKADLSIDTNNKVLKNGRLIADLNCFMENLADKVISNQIFMTIDEKRNSIKNVMMWKKYIKGDKDFHMKNFFIKVYESLVNSALITDKKNIIFWGELTSKMTDVIVNEIDENEIDESYNILPSNEVVTIYNST